MYVTSRHFDFIKHWDEDQKIKAVAITVELSVQYKGWLEDPFSDAFIGINMAYKAYEERLEPRQLNGYIRTYLHKSAQRKQKFANTCRDHTLKNGRTVLPAVEIYTLPEPDSIEIELFLRDVKKILSDEEYDLFVKIFVDDDAPMYSDESARRHRLRMRNRILKKLKAELYGVQ